MRKIPLKTRKIVAGATFAAALVVLIIPFLVLGIDTATLYLNELLLMATLIVIVPSAILDYENQKWVSSVEKQMPVPFLDQPCRPRLRSPRPVQFLLQEER